MDGDGVTEMTYVNKVIKSTTVTEGTCFIEVIKKSLN